MKLLICLITFNRLAYSKETLANLKRTIKCPHYIVVVDNASTDKTAQWLDNQPTDLVIINPANFYPGKACNIGWERGLKQYPEATHLMRLDNDMDFEPDWSAQAEDYFKAIPELGQLGLDNNALDSYNGNPDYLTSGEGKTVNLWPGNIGGPCIIPKSVWDSGIRYDETPWYHDGGARPTAQEDARLSLEILVKGWKVGHPTDKLAWTFATPDKWSKYPEYYKKTMEERGYDYNVLG